MEERTDFVLHSMSDDLLTMEGGENDAVAPPRLPHIPCVIPDDKYPTLVIDANTVLVWCELDEDFRPELLSPIVDYAHEVFCELREWGVSDFFGGYSGCWHIGEWEATLAAKLGLIYRQPFLVELYARHYAYQTHEGTEYDCEIRFELKHISSLPKEEIAARWEEWINRGQTQ